ncbi:hypothetical protein C4D60_Mb01t23440 [Musa balbisiana]|uniref:EXS domain-containing protein n=1 Tax=Musa balbisiana TaxID=52838 RepID=A0A4S8JQB7_MUSBA|nr:hypothetical protein C4D60_Mb01t23440 [Musa balbisiana]
MVAAAAKLKYAVEPTPLWMVIVVITSTGATFYQLFWDFVKDWGLLDLSSKNLFLRDDLILKNKCVYYVSIVGVASVFSLLVQPCPKCSTLTRLRCVQGLNFVLRLAWIQSVMRLTMGQAEHRLMDFLLASLEIIRRGHWNFYRSVSHSRNMHLHACIVRIAIKKADAVTWCM